VSPRSTGGLVTTRLDVALVERGLVRSRSRARELIDAGKVRVAGTQCRKASQPVDGSVAIDVEADAWVSRAAHKLLGALDDAEITVPPRILDAGASTGGFTQVCLARGAERVYAIDVGHGQLDPTLRTDPRVVVREGLNLRTLSLDAVEGVPVDLVVADVSFISLTLVVGPLLGVLHPEGVALLLVKPQFEVGRERLGAGGVVRSDADRQAAVLRVVEACGEFGWRAVWQGQSQLPGADGNVEFFVAFRKRNGDDGHAATQASRGSSTGHEAPGESSTPIVRPAELSTSIDTLSA